MDLVYLSNKVVQTMKLDFLEPSLLQMCPQYRGNVLNIYAKPFMILMKLFQRVR